jgi:hypothetical protein
MQQVWEFEPSNCNYPVNAVGWADGLPRRTCVVGDTGV